MYGLKSASADFRSFMAKKLDEIGFKYSPSDPNTWLRPAIKPGGEEYYEYVLMYVENILAILMKPTKIPKSIEGKTVKYKNVKIAPPEMYLGENMKQKMMNGNM